MVSVFLAVFAARRLKKVSFALRTATLTAVCCQEPLVLKKCNFPRRFTKMFYYPLEDLPPLWQAIGSKLLEFHKSRKFISTSSSSLDSQNRIP